MSKFDANKLIAFLQTKWGENKCPMCRQGNWSVQNDVYELREFHGGNMVIGNSAIIPIIPITCDNCANTVLVNAIMAGSVEKEASQDE